MNRMRRRWSVYYDNSRLEFSTLIGRKLTTNTMTAIAAEGQFLQQPNDVDVAFFANDFCQCILPFFANSQMTCPI